MSYTRLTWVESETPLSAQNMNNIEDGIEELQAQKVDKTSGKGLSTNDYTTAEKTKLAGIAAGAEVNPGDFVGANASVAGVHGLVPAPTSTDFMTKKLLCADGSWHDLRFRDTHLNGILHSMSIVDGALNFNLYDANTTRSGLMSATDKTKLDGIAAGAEVNKSISSLVLTTNSNVTFQAGNFFRIAFVSAVTSNKPVVTGIREMKFINSSNGASNLLTGGYTWAVGAVTGGWKTTLTIALWNPMSGDVTLDASKSSITLAIYGD